MYHRLTTLFKHITKDSFKFLHKYVFSMEKAYLRLIVDAEQFQLTFRYQNSNLNIDREFNFCRQLQENVDVFLGRLTSNVEKVITKKNRKKQIEIPALAAELLLNSCKIPGDKICKEVFIPSCSDNIILKILDKEYTIIINSPWLSNIALPKSIMTDFPVYPSKFETVNTEKHLSSFKWYKSEDKTNWNLVGDGFIYIPNNSDINSFLKLSCTPKNGYSEGPMTETISEVKVEASPGFCPFENRHQFTKTKKSGEEFRVVSYNILADLYCDSDFARTSLFPYCPPYALSIDYRKQLILKELIGYNADLICLQELDNKIYINDIEPVFNSLNYSSVFRLKGGTVSEGLCCIFNNDRFRLLETNHIVMGEQLNNNIIFGDIWKKIQQNEKFVERFLPRTTAVHTTTLESTQFDEILLVANIHLYFHPNADHIRLLQAGLAIRYVEDIIEKLQSKYNKRVSLIFCGDFNSVPDCGIYKLYTTGSVGEDCIDWISNQEEAVKGLSLTQPFDLASACGTPKFTNYTAGFADCLDYIFYERTKLAVTEVIPLPTNQELMEHTAIPSIVCPSDHIALISDLKWT